MLMDTVWLGFSPGASAAKKHSPSEHKLDLDAFPSSSGRFASVLGAWRPCVGCGQTGTPGKNNNLRPSLFIVIGLHCAFSSSTCYLELDRGLNHMLFVNYWDSVVGTMPLTPSGLLNPGKPRVERTANIRAAKTRTLPWWQSFARARRKKEQI